MKGRFRKGLKGNGPAVNLESYFHLTEIRRRFNQAYREYNVDKLTKEQAKKIIDLVYYDAPRLKNAAKKWIDGR